MDNTDQNVVLVVDDSPDTIGMLNDTLHEAGYVVLVALDGEQALQIASRMRPDIILLDAIMPSMNGFDACKALKQTSGVADIPVIFMTGLSEPEHIEQALAVGGVDYITKPIHARVLIARIQVHLANARLSQSTRQALDKVGQYTLATDEHGQSTWMTPQTESMLALAGVESAWFQNTLPKYVQPWLTGERSSDQGFKIPDMEKSLKLGFIGQVGKDEYLFRLEHGDNTDAVAKIRHHFELTEREAEVLAWIAHGKTNREIGLILATSPRTVNKHLEQIFRKLDVDNRTAAAAKAIRCIVR